MDIYDKLVENPLFFKWIYYPSEELRLYWNSYLKQNPEESARILEFKKQFKKYLKFENKQLSEKQKRDLAKQIIKKIEAKDKSKNHVAIVRQLLKYAAVAILFFSIGSSLVYLYMERRQPEFVLNNSVLPAHVQDPVLITDDNKQVPLNKGNSELDYSGKEEVIVDNNKAFDKNSEELPEINTVVIPYGNRSFITLADGSKVWLNAGSRLIYPSEFVDKNREVFLVGEAYFEVQKDESKPFVVKTPDVRISVLGTKFNVSAYPEDYSVQTVLTEGSIKISRADAGIFGKNFVITPGQMAYFNKKSKETNIYSVNTENYTLWAKGLLNFSNTDLNRITKNLERFYNIRFQFDDQLKGFIQITGKLDVSSEKSEVLEYLSKLTGLEFVKINDRHYLIK